MRNRAIDLFIDSTIYFFLINLFTTLAFRPRYSKRFVGDLPTCSEEYSGSEKQKQTFTVSDIEQNVSSVRRYCKISY